MITHTTFADWIDEYVLSHDISDETIAWYRRSLTHAERWAGQRFTIATITDRIVNEMTVAMLEANKSPDYVRSLRNAILALWRDAAAAGHCEPPKRIRSVRRSITLQHVIWSVEQISRLLATATTITGQFRSLAVDRAIYWDTLIRTAWDTALRRRDLHRLRRCDLSPDFVWEQHKKKKPIRVRVRDSTLKHIEAWGRHDTAILWPLWGCDETFRQAFTKLVRRSGIPHGPFKTIRKSAGTAAEAQRPGAGHLLLGNTRAVFEAYYLDQCQIDAPRPPELT